MELNITNQDLISSNRNPLVKRLRELSKKEFREKSSLLLLEGTHLLQEALSTSSYPQEIVATKLWLHKNSEILRSIPYQVPIYEVTQSVLKFALTTVNPDGVASVLPVNRLPTLKSRPGFILALDRLQDPGNLGNLFRTALAADIDVIWLAGGVDPLNPKVLRSSSGAFLHLPYERFFDTEDNYLQQLAKKLKTYWSNGYQVIGTVVPSDNSQESIAPYWEIDWTDRIILLLGNEASGLHPLLKDCCTKLVTLPHSPLVESLNVAAAAVPLLLERRRATMSAGIYQKQ